MGFYSGMIMDGPLKGQRRAHSSPKLNVETIDEEDVLVPIRMNDGAPDQAMVRRSYTYVWVEAGHGRLPGWWLQ